MDQLADTLIGHKAAIVGLWLGAIFLAERVRPAAAPAVARPGEPAGGYGRIGRNAALWLCNAGLSLLVVVPLTAAAANQHLGLRPESWRGPLALAGDLVLLDFLIYWWHRANHRLPLLWRFHEVHHLDRFLDSTSALRFHFGEVLLAALARAGVILLLGIPLATVLLFETLLLCATIFHHSNLRLPARLERLLARIVVTPSIHWVHHHARRADTDSNYSTLLSFWDRLFRSASPTARRPDMEIGVENRAERPLALLFVRPFRRRTTATAENA